LATFFSTLAGVIVTSLYQRINLLNRTLLLTLGGACLFIATVIWGFSQMDGELMNRVSTTVANILLMTIIVGFILAGVRKKENVYDAFIEGAKDGFQTAVRIIPYLVAILVGIGVFRASGAMDMLIDGIKWGVNLTGMNTDFVEALPTALMKPLSGSGARGMMVDAMQTFGADSFVGRLSCIFQGSTDTTFYILAVYFGSVGIKNTRHAVACGLLADLAGVIAAIAIAYLFFA
jgi:spore maturation protein SpmB